MIEGSGMLTLVREKRCATIGGSEQTMSYIVFSPPPRFEVLLRWWSMPIEREKILSPSAGMAAEPWSCRGAQAVSFCSL